jgi:site-specific DNA-methyltransferase (adenine-specific)
LDPFAGSGTTVEACLTEGVRCVAVEREAGYLPLIQARIDRQGRPATPDDGQDALFAL